MRTDRKTRMRTQCVSYAAACGPHHANTRRIFRDYGAVCEKQRAVVILGEGMPTPSKIVPHVLWLVQVSVATRTTVTITTRLIICLAIESIVTKVKVIAIVTIATIRIYHYH